MGSVEPLAQAEKPRIGFCGLGSMGGGMACNLARKGFNIVGFDVYAPSLDRLVAAGGRAALSPREAAHDSEFLILMVVNAAQVDAVLLDPDTGSVHSLPRNATIILCSTCPPAYLHELRTRLDNEAARPDIKLLDCPVSGGSIRAAKGMLSIFSSGLDSDLDAADLILTSMANPLYRIPGGISFGSIAKLCHQHQAAVNIITASEAMALAAAAGLNTRAVYETVIKSKGRSWFLENRGPHMLDDDFLTVHSAVTIILKDAIIVTEHAKREGFPLILGNMAQQLYILACNKDIGSEDDAGLVRLYLSHSDRSRVAQLGQKDAGCAASAEGKAGITIDTIVDLMAGIHLASAAECLHFAKHVGMDLQLLYDIVARGAGQSNMFDEVAHGWKGLAAFEGTASVESKLEQALQRASSIRQACPMGSAALQSLRLHF